MTKDDETVYTLEADGPDDTTFVGGVRHTVCVTRTDQFYCKVIDHPADDLAANDPECWGCAGWLNQPPLTPEETAEKLRPD